MKVIFSLFFLLLPLAPLAQEFSPTNKSLSYPSVSNEKMDSLIENSAYNDVLKEVPAFLRKGVEQHNLKSLIYVKSNIYHWVSRSRLPEKELEALFHELHVIWDQSTGYEQTIMGWMLINLLDHYRVASCFGYDEESLTWYVGDGYTRLYNRKNDILYQVYIKQILEEFYKTTRIPSSALGLNRANVLPTLGDQLLDFFLTKGLESEGLSKERVSLLKDLLFEFHYQRKEWEPIRFLILSSTHTDGINEHLKFLQKWEGIIEDDNSSYLSLYLAQQYVTQSLTYHFQTNREVENKALDAIKKIDETNEKYPAGSVRDKLDALKAEILAKELSFELPIVPRAEHPVLLRLNYRNVDEVFVEVRHITRIKGVDENNPGTFKGYKYDKEKFRASYEVTDRERHLRHKTDLLINCFPTTGHYLVVIGKNKNEVRDFFKLKPEDELPSTSFLILEVTNLGASSGISEDSLFVHVVNRWTGKSVKKATVEVETNNKTENLLTNRHGLTQTQATSYARITIKKEEDSTKIVQYGSRNWQDRSSKDAVYFDRPIYRPGQMIQMKILASHQKGNRLEVASNEKRVIIVSSRNSSELYNGEITTNEFGSYFLTLTTKTNTPTGYYTVSSDGQEIGSFQLEEYKRPTFLVVFDPIKGIMANNNPVTISGSVKAYAGYPLASELVKIQIKKFEYRGYKYSSLSTDETDTLIMIYTDNSGRFSFTYTPRYTAKTFGTSIYCEAKVTRNTGETNFAQTNFYVGNERYNMDLYRVEREGWNFEGFQAKITGNNQNSIDKFVDFYILKRKNVKRYVLELDRTEFSRFSEKEWSKAFPNMMYGELVKEYDTITMGVIQTEQTLNLDQYDLVSGEYKIIFSVIMGPKEVLTNEQTFVWREKGWNYTTEALEIYSNKTEPALLENIPIRINTAWKKVRVMQMLENENQKKFSTYTLKVGSDFTLSLDSNYYFGGQVFASFWKDGYYFSNSYHFQPRDTTRQLEWRWIHKTNESEPGAKETWSFELRDAYGFYVEGEALLNAYDASLDQFAQAYFKIPTATNTYHPTTWSSQEPNYYKAFKSKGASNLRAFASLSSDEIIEFADEESDSFRGDSESGSVRKNFNETALFTPQLRTKAGENSFEITMPDNLTTYHFNGFAHTKDGRFTHEKTDFVVKKKLILEMNQPRFMRSKDELNWEINFRNLSNKELRLKPVIQFFSVKTGEDITALFNLQKLEELTIKPGKSQSWYLPFEVPNLDINEVKIRVEGRTLDYSDIVESKILVLPSFDEQVYAKSWVLYPKTNKILTWNATEKIPSSAKISAVQVSYTADEHLLYLDRLVQNFYRINDLTESYFYQYASLSVAQHLMQTVYSLNNLASSRLNDLDGETQGISTDQLWPETKTRQEKLFQGYQLLLNSDALENARHQAYLEILDRQEASGLWSWIGKGHGNSWLTSRLIDEYIQLGDLGVLFDSDPFIKAVRALDSIQSSRFDKLEDKNLFGITEERLSWYQARTSLVLEETAASKYFMSKLDSTWRKLAIENWSKVANIYILREDNMSAEVIYKALEKMKVKDTSLGEYWVTPADRFEGYKEDVNLRNQIVGWKLRFYQVPPDSMRLYVLQNVGGMANLTPDLDLLMATFYLSLKQNSSIAGELIPFGKEPIKVDRLSMEKNFGSINLEETKSGIRASNFGDNFILVNAEVAYQAPTNEVKKSNEEFRIERQYYLVYNGEEIPMRKGLTLHEGSLIRVKLKILSPTAMSYLELVDPRMAGAEPKETKSGYAYGDVLYWVEPRDTKTSFYIENLPAGTSEVSYDVVLTSKGILVAPAANVKSYYQSSKKANTEGNIWNIEP